MCTQDTIIRGEIIPTHTTSAKLGPRPPCPSANLVACHSPKADISCRTGAVPFASLYPQPLAQSLAYRWRLLVAKGIKEDVPGI